MENLRIKKQGNKAIWEEIEGINLFTNNQLVTVIKQGPQVNITFNK